MANWDYSTKMKEIEKVHLYNLINLKENYEKKIEIGKQNYLKKIENFNRNYPEIKDEREIKRIQQEKRRAQEERIKNQEARINEQEKQRKERELRRKENKNRGDEDPLKIDEETRRMDEEARRMDEEAKKRDLKLRRKDQEMRQKEIMNNKSYNEFDTFSQIPNLNNFYSNGNHIIQQQHFPFQQVNPGFIYNQNMIISQIYNKGNNINYKNNNFNGYCYPFNPNYNYKNKIKLINNKEKFYIQWETKMRIQ